MKRKIVLFMMIATMSLSMVGCTNNFNSVESSCSTELYEESGFEEIPEAVKNKLQAAINMEPVTLSSADATDEKVRDLIYINGEKLKDPFTLADFGEGICFQEEELILQKSNLYSSFLKYYNFTFASCIVKDCNSLDEVYESPVEYISFYHDEDTDIENMIYPISINGVTIGSTLEKFKSSLGFMEQVKAGNQTMSSAYVYKGKNIHAYVYIKGKNVEKIIIKNL